MVFLHQIFLEWSQCNRAEITAAREVLFDVSETLALHAKRESRWATRELRLPAAVEVQLCNNDSGREQ